jgi:hypothetical protein
MSASLTAKLPASPGIPLTSAFRLTGKGLSKHSVRSNSFKSVRIGIGKQALLASWP